mmetsp:Transcript_11134/g.27874  ORF Transcript_11134/g.27874 Transcript_11134/m.27874 type:complete len:255 (-) Transcript_11134:805-1569(-)
MSLQDPHCLGELRRVLPLECAICEERNLLPAPRLRQATVVQGAVPCADVAEAWRGVGVVPVLAVGQLRHVGFILRTDRLEVCFQHAAHQEALRIVPRLGQETRHEVRGPLPPVVPQAALDGLHGERAHVLVPTIGLVPFQRAYEVDVARLLLRIYLQAPPVPSNGSPGAQMAELRRRYQFGFPVDRWQPRLRRTTKFGIVTSLVQQHTLVVVGIRILRKAESADNGPHPSFIQSPLRFELLCERIRLCLVVHRL